MPYCEEETKRTRKEGLTREKEKKNEMTAIKREWGGNKSEGAKKGHNSLAQVSGGKRARYREKGRRRKKTQSSGGWALFASHDNMLKSLQSYGKQDITRFPRSYLPYTLDHLFLPLPDTSQHPSPSNMNVHKVLAQK